MSNDDTPDLEEELADVGEGADAAEAAQDEADEQADETDERMEALEERVTELEMEERRDQQLEAMEPGEEIFDKVFPATVATDGSFTELVSLAGTLTTYPDGRTGDAMALANGQSVLVEVVDPGTTPPSMKFVIISGGSGIVGPTGTPGAAGLVRIKADGTDGDGYPTYSVYAVTDVTLTTPLITGATPTDARWRGADGLDVTAAEDGSMEVSGYDDGGDLVLVTAAETVCANSSAVVSFVADDI